MRQGDQGNGVAAAFAVAQHIEGDFRGVSLNFATFDAHAVDDDRFPTDPEMVLGTDQHVAQDFEIGIENPVFPGIFRQAAAELRLGHILHGNGDVGESSMPRRRCCCRPTLA